MLSETTHSDDPCVDVLQRAAEYCGHRRSGHAAYSNLSALNEGETAGNGSDTSLKG